jgi:hypothetical protein
MILWNLVPRPFGSIRWHTQTRLMNWIWASALQAVEIRLQVLDDKLADAIFGDVRATGLKMDAEPCGGKTTFRIK